MEYTREQMLYEAIGGIDPKFVKEATEMKASKKRRIRHLPAMIAAVLAVMTLAATATVLIYRGTVNDPLVTENKRLDEVPEGYVGITTAEELDAIRDQPGGNYILMADISLAGREWDPIGTLDEPFRGIFNGNGYVVSDMTIRYEAGFEDEAFIGLFGSAPGAIITNLGMENAEITVTNAWSTHVGVIAGSAGYLMSCYTEDCRISVDVNINVVHINEELRNERDTVSRAELARVKAYNIVGGIGGKVTTMDSCVSGTDVTLGGYVSEVAKRELIEREINDGVIPLKLPTRDVHLYAGKLCGYVYSVVTSYANGTLVDQTDSFDIGLVGYENISPAVMPAPLYHTMMDRLAEVYSDSEKGETDTDALTSAHFINWKGLYRKATQEEVEAWLDQLAQYDMSQARDVGTGILVDDNDTVKRYLSPQMILSPHRDESLADQELHTVLQPFFYGEYELAAEYYLLDFDGGRLETRFVVDCGLRCVLTEEELRALWDSYHLKVGVMYCYDLAQTPNTDFEGFDLENVWTMKDGKPILRIFADA